MNDSFAHDHIVNTFSFYIDKGEGYPPGGFQKALYEAFLMADNHNFARLAEGFPEEARIIKHWRETGEVV